MACEHECNHHHEKESKKDIVMYIISIIIFILSFFPIFSEYKIILYLVTIIFSGYELIIEGIKNIFKLNFEEDTLMTIAIIAAFILGEYPESCMVILLFKLGEFIEERAEKKSESNIEKIAKIKVNEANILIGDKEEKIKAEELKINDIILIKPGEKVPVDCRIILGNSELDTSAITGESKLKEVKENEEILSGTINMTSAIKCIVIRDFKNSTASQIVDLIYEATNNKGKTEKFITKFSKIYTPSVIVLALILAILPILLGYDAKTWVMRALIFLVASCPCSIIISIPLAFFNTIGAISRQGMIVKGTKHIENLSKTNVIAFDKTGTLTTGKMEIDKIEILEENKENLLNYIYNLESLSNHPIASAIKEMNVKTLKLEVKDFKEVSGCGLYGKIGSDEILIGNNKLLEKYNIKYNKKEDVNYIVINNEVAGYLILKEKIRNESEDLISELKKINVKRTIMLTGDNKKQAENISNSIGIKEVYAELLPKQKLEIIEEIKNNKKNKVVFVGDGINDGPVLGKADFGISMGTATDIANDIADGILISNDLSKIPNIIKISRKGMRIVKSNIIFSLLVKLIVLILGSMGIAPIWLAVLADTGTTLVTVINSLRIR